MFLSISVKLLPDHFIRHIPSSLVALIEKTTKKQKDQSTDGSASVEDVVQAWLNESGTSITVTKQQTAPTCLCSPPQTCILCQNYNNSIVKDEKNNSIVKDEILKLLCTSTSWENCSPPEIHHDDTLLHVILRYKFGIDIQRDSTYQDLKRFVYINLTGCPDARQLVRCWFLRNNVKLALNVLGRDGCQLRPESIPMKPILDILSAELQKLTSSSPPLTRLVSTITPSQTSRTEFCTQSTDTQTMKTRETTGIPTPTCTPDPSTEPKMPHTPTITEQQPAPIVTPESPTPHRKSMDCPSLSKQRVTKRHTSEQKPTKQSTNRSLLPFTKRNTRNSVSKKAKLLLAGSSAKTKIKYNNGERHMPGDPVKYSPMTTLKNLRSMTIDETKKNRLIASFQDLCAFHQGLTKTPAFSMPRDTWQEWIDKSCHDDDGDSIVYDRAFMCLMVILMSSSTADSQLAVLVPRLFSTGLTSATDVIEFAKMYGMDVLCSLLTSTGRFYQNAERIVNAADHFVSLHGGIIPPNISVEEIGTLFGVGYKTANIVITYAFDRMDGIPADIHVIRWAVHLGWVPHNCTDGYECSKAIEEWLPKNYWHKVNPVFGSLGQMVNTQTIPFRTLLESKQVQPPEVARLCLSIFKKYGH